MREIKFRGIHVHVMEQNLPLNGTWVYGYLCDENYINSKEYCGEMLINPETVGQFTGFFDKNGTEIYEGDIIAFDGNVWYSTNKFKDFLNGVEKDYDDYLEVVEYNFEYLSTREHDFKNYCKIVGNIYENSDLLEVIK